MKKLYAAIRIRSLIDRNPEVRKTVDLLRLRRVNSCSIFPAEKSFEGMLKLASQVLTYGEIEKGVLIELLKKRGRTINGKKLSEEILKKFGFADFSELADYIFETGKIPSFMKPYFRLHPPRKGFKRSTKKYWLNKGELGYRGRDINELILRMI